MHIHQSQRRTSQARRNARRACHSRSKVRTPLFLGSAVVHWTRKPGHALSSDARWSRQCSGWSYERVFNISALRGESVCQGKRSHEQVKNSVPWGVRRAVYKHRSQSAPVHQHGVDVVHQGEELVRFVILDELALVVQIKFGMVVVIVYGFEKTRALRSEEAGGQIQSQGENWVRGKSRLLSHTVDVAVSSTSSSLSVPLSPTSPSEDSLWLSENSVSLSEHTTASASFCLANDSL